MAVKEISSGDLPGKIKKDNFILYYNAVNEQRAKIFKDYDNLKKSWDDVVKACQVVISKQATSGELEKKILLLKKSAKLRSKCTQDRKKAFNDRMKADLEKQKYNILEKKLADLEVKYNALAKAIGK